jgi:cytoskeletal protein RodZ
MINNSFDLFYLHGAVIDVRQKCNWEADMKPSEPVSAEKDAVNREPDTSDSNRPPEGRGPTFTEIANVHREPAAVDLKGLREARGLTLRDIFSATRITVTNLEAIEMGHYDLLPAPVYTRTFIRTYAGILDVDSAPILEHYESYLKSRETSRDVQEEDHRELPAKGKKTPGIRILYWLAGAIVLIGLIVAVVLIDVKDVTDLFSARQTGPQKITSPPATAPTPAATTATGPVPPTAPVAPPAVPAGSPPSALTAPIQKSAPPGGIPKQEEPLSLKIEAVELTWIRISADGKQPEQMMLRNGDRIERKARESFSIDIGNAGGLLVSFQDKPLPSLGKRGEVTHLKLP